jgi:hypothetical protein
MFDRETVPPAATDVGVKVAYVSPYWLAPYLKG